MKPARRGVVKSKVPSVLPTKGGTPMKLSRLALAFALVLAAAPPALADAVKIPDASQKASVSQTIGYTDVAVAYHRPVVNKREIWGKLVPYDLPWRCGANENTTVTFSTPVSIEGQALAAGTYGLHMIPGKDTWVVAFSK